MKAKRKAWYYFSFQEYTLLILGVTIQRVLIMPIWVIGMTIQDEHKIPLTLFFDTPIAGIHPIKTISLIMGLLWIQLFLSGLQSILENYHHPLKLVVIYAILGLILYSPSALCLGMLRNMLYV